MLLAVIAVIILSLITLILCLPVTYAVKIHIGSPWHIEGQYAWGRRLANASWSYTLGEEPHSESHVFWQKAPQKGSDDVQPDKPPTPEEREKALDELEAESKKTIYEDLLQEEGTETPPEPSAPAADAARQKPPLREWLPLFLNSDFLAAFFTWLARLLHHGQIRRFSLTGILGLPAPHETGMLAGALYAVCPGNVEELQFNFVEEQYDCTVRASGRLYPAALLLFTAAFAASRPVRHILAYWHAVRKGVETHG